MLSEKNSLWIRCASSLDVLQVSSSLHEVLQVNRGVQGSPPTSLKNPLNSTDWSLLMPPLPPTSWSLARVATERNYDIKENATVISAKLLTCQAGFNFQPERGNWFNQCQSMIKSPLTLPVTNLPFTGTLHLTSTKSSTTLICALDGPILISQHFTLF
jgi:hypothetical protein